ncbi:DNA primase [Acidocella aminolytica]|uniref:DNA primase n=1 Tax=Acidocella aminolytica 101 = DSM 11237 TaxID=1120923 RepID=A0A0D6PD04_9PROT|nr:DNA primase [Acidocella aminolytica]GAN78739.1 DNA primase [Acidocella aminolytica 101 = DSM 11237]GBQ38742.1 DNA primase [Acidocella aminolytica 101 = DSM 11237]SHE78938.1 DNA primase [Acidocella aminolytica 101 = DSM 11237]
MALPANFLDELRARTPIAAVIGRSVKLSRSSRDWKGCCPFHGEKTPSFYVYDDHYHCFGCGEHGDVITFVMKTTGASFMEAVEDLAAQAGLDVPKPSPQAAQAEARRASLSEVLEAALKEYQLWLWGQEGRAALDYLRRRGLADDTIRRFQLGWSGEGRGQLAAALRGHNIMPDQLIEAGLMKQGERGSADMFFGRVMFPIRDRRGALISFGGRIMGDGQPKYVNGPETALFSKRRSLYGLNLAREAVRKGARMIVVEGYMDVIALSQAGFGGAVAPLGTSLTEEHLEEIWKLTPEPVICFDGDMAGQRAALKTAELALTQLTPEKSLKLLRLPPKDDPDSLIKRGGKQAFEAELVKAQPLSAVLFDMLKAGQDLATPEGRARFRQRLTDAANSIPDKMLAGEYRTALMDSFFAGRQRPAAGRGFAKGRFTPSPPPVLLPPRSAPDPSAAQVRRARLMLAILLAFPALIPEVEEAFARVTLPDVDEPLREALHGFVSQAKTLDSASLFTHLGSLGLGEQARALQTQANVEFRLAQDASPAEAVRNWWSLYELMDFSIDMLRMQRDEAQAFWLANPQDRAACDRLIRYNQLLERARSGAAGVEEF